MKVKLENSPAFVRSQYPLHLDLTIIIIMISILAQHWLIIQQDSHCKRQIQIKCFERGYIFSSAQQYQFLKEEMLILRTLRIIAE
jgi:hypothetical protein